MPKIALPPGADKIAQWAARSGFHWQPVPEQSWFQAWEPYDTMVAPQKYVNSVTRPYRSGAITFVEPWMADDDTTPIDRTWLTFACHTRLVRRASARVGESFLTRVAFIESPPPPRVQLGDADWDGWAATFALRAEDAQQAFRPPLRQLLRASSFQGHIELRPGGLVMQVAGVTPSPETLDWLVRFAAAVVDAAVPERG